MRSAGRQGSIDERNDFVRDHFLRDPTDPSHYDLILNSARLPVATQADLIIETLHKLEACVAERDAQNVAAYSI